MFRLHGRMRKLETKTLEADDTVALMKSIAPERCQRELQEKGGPTLASPSAIWPGSASRFSSSAGTSTGAAANSQRHAHAGAVGPARRVDQAGPSAPRSVPGDGPDRVGQNTTLASLVNYINENVDHHIITIEDPIEFYHYHKKSTINQREIGVDVPSFSEAIRRALRQDPDVILVGEMRDLETIEAAITAAETGHVVFGTLHTNSAKGTVNRIIDAFPGNLQDQIRTQLSTSIIGVVAQTLLPKIGGGRVCGLRNPGL